MKTEKYTHADHRHLVEAWLAARGIPAPPREMSSDIGFVVEGRAIGFLYLTASRLAYIDQFVTEPGLPENQREELLQRLINSLSDEAKRHGVWLVVALCGSQNMQNRFYRAGFVKEAPFTLVKKTLKEIPPCHG